MKTKLLTSILTLVAVAGIVTLTGCAVASQHATTTTTTPEGVQTVTKADSRIMAIGDARNSVEKARASAGKTSSVGASGVTEEATTTNAARLVIEVIGAVPK